MAHAEFASCIEACNACALECDHCSVACLAEDDPKAMARCIALDMDCAQACRLAVAFMARGSELSGEICAACAEVCEACAEECARHESMEHCRRCAEACRRCAEECRRMAGTRAQGKQSARARAGH